ncbi:MAG: sulfite exporter TauE/SafE family protein [Methylophilaceae bacterium]|nr:sulfite exporter TauE/SafE family protein [Methylophilaceae bacterium]
MLELSLMSAFLVGLLGGGHCVGMCGGIVGAVSMHLPKSKSKIPFLLTYNVGRILSYTLAGAIAGLVGASSFFLQHVLPIQHVLSGISCLMLIALGLYLAGIWHGVTYLESAGKAIWKILQPYSKRYIPVQNCRQALILGGLWGWLPCGLVYSVLIAAIATGSAMSGGLLMLAFGLGTLPTLVTMGMAAVRLKTVLQNIWVRRASGLLVLGFGLLGLLRLI